MVDSTLALPNMVFILCTVQKAHVVGYALTNRRHASFRHEESSKKFEN